MIEIVFGVILPWLVVAVGCWVGYQMLRQNGRILTRLEALEQQLGKLAEAAAAAQAAPSAQPAPNAYPSLPLGAPAPAFELPALAGGRVSLSQYRGKRVLLVFFGPQCGYCVQMAPDLAALPVDGSDGHPIPVIVTAGDLQENRRLVKEHDIRAPVLMQRENEVAAAYHAPGTPSGYLVDEEGRIASPIAVGAKPLLELARAGSAGSGAAAQAAVPSANGNGHKTYHGNLPLAASRIKRDGLAAGTPAPDFRLQRVGGGELSLAEYRGRQVLLVFSDPKCGPCDHLAPQLEAIHRRQRELGLVMVSRGEVEENRKKMAELGLSFPVVLQKQWEVSRDYAMFATPVGYLIDEQGTIAADVALGEDAILALASRASSLTHNPREGVPLA